MSEVNASNNNFIHSIIDEDLKNQKYGDKILTRFLLNRTDTCTRHADMPELYNRYKIWRQVTYGMMIPIRRRRIWSVEPLKKM